MSQPNHSDAVFFRMLWGCLGACLLLFAFACGPVQEPGDCKEAGVRLHIVQEDGTPPKAYQVTVSLASGDSLTVYCDGGSPAQNEALLCTSKGVILRRYDTSVRYAIKARGSRTTQAKADVQFESINLNAPADKCEGRYQQATAKVTLSALPAFKSTADYRTGFSAKTGLDDFRKMAVESSGESGTSLVVKFYIELLEGNPKVYFQQTKKHPLHYGFIRKVLGKSLSLDEYELQTYFGADRKGMAGNIIFYPDRVVPSRVLGKGKMARSPVTIEFFPSDNLTPQQALQAHRLIEERLHFVPLQGEKHRLFYLPAGTSHASKLQASAGLFRALGSLWLAREELYGNITMQLLNPGIAYGTLRLYTPEQLKRAVVSFQDILVLPRLPNELPIVGGTITGELQTPLAHVNVAARNRGTPNMSLRSAAEDPRIKPFLSGKQLVRLEVSAKGFTLRKATLEEAQKFWKSRSPEKIPVPTPDLTRKGLLDFAKLSFQDSQVVGVKAANLSELYNLLKAKKHTPNGFAVPFYYYEEFFTKMTFPKTLCIDAQRNCVEEKRASAVCQKVASFCGKEKDPETLETYAKRLLADADFQVDSVFREAALDGLRYLFHYTPVDGAFGKLLDEKVKQLVGDKKVRLRSSTNAEDLANFSGAGLYRSISASSADPLKLPSLRIRKVWASVWSWRAFEERSFWNIEHLAIRMGVAVHRSFPDEEANGVLITRNINNPGVSGYYVNVQLGEVSVTNPEGGALPEIFSIIRGAGGVDVIRERFSSLSPDKGVMTPKEIETLYAVARDIQRHFVKLYPDIPDLALDMEFKLDKDTRLLIVKQARPYRQQ